MSDHVGFARVFIELINENDNRPIFSKPLYNISLPENTPPGTSLLRILVSITEKPEQCVLLTAKTVLQSVQKGFLSFIPEEKFNWNLIDCNKTWLVLVTFIGLV